MSVATCSTCGAAYPDAVIVRCVVCKTPRDASGDGVPMVATTLRVDRAKDHVARAAAAAGAQITGETETSLTLTVRVRERVNPGVAVLLFLFFLVPGIIYVAIVNSRFDTHSANIRFSQTKDGSEVTWGGGGRALVIAMNAVRSLPQI